MASRAVGKSGYAQARPHRYLVWCFDNLCVPFASHVVRASSDECGSSSSFPSDATEGNEDDPVRDLTTIREMIMESGLPPAVKERSVRVFTELGEAEAKTHGSTLDQVGALSWHASCMNLGFLQAASDPVGCYGEIVFMSSSLHQQFKKC